mmetsp:Transcript_56029/g.76456  ORF Transcript_56029/g.76456 Transcript_56029/m.76456 type:complete len:102 (+) Transcript_56029:170-475(+)
MASKAQRHATRAPHDQNRSRRPLPTQVDESSPSQVPSFTRNYEVHGSFERRSLSRLNPLVRENGELQSLLSLPLWGLGLQERLKLHRLREEEDAHEAPVRW